MEYIEIKMKHFFFFTRLFSEAVSQSREKNIKESAEVQKRERERERKNETQKPFVNTFFRAIFLWTEASFRCKRFRLKWLRLWESPRFESQSLNPVLRLLQLQECVSVGSDVRLQEVSIYNAAVSPVSPPSASPSNLKSVLALRLWRQSKR